MLLEELPSFDEAVERIAESPVLLSEVCLKLPALRVAATAPASEADVMDIIGRRFALYPQPERSDAEWSAWWADYFEVLHGVPIAALEGGMGAWVKSPQSEFLPKPGKLRELALQTPNRAAQRYVRAKASMRTPPEDRGEMIPEGAERVKEMLAEFHRQQELRTTKVKTPSLFRSQGEVDASGLTAEMRALIARQSQGDARA